MPIRGQHFQFDLSAMLLGLAFSRGLFKYKSLQDLHAGDEMFLAKDPKVNKQAVFVAAETQSGAIKVEQAMRLGAANPKLQDMCVKVGIASYVSLYALRRTAILEMRRTEGTEMAKDLAGHAQRSETISTYDVFGLKDLDITAVRLGDDPVKRDEMRKMFSLATLNRPTIAGQAPGSTTQNASLAKRLDEAVAEAMKHEDKYKDIETELSTFLDEAADILDMDAGARQTASFDTYRKQLIERDDVEAADKLDKILARRRKIRGNLKSKLKRSELDKIEEENRKLAKVTKSHAKRPIGPREQPQGIRNIVEAGEENEQLVDFGADEQEKIIAMRDALGFDEDSESVEEQEDAEMDPDMLEEIREGQDPTGAPDEYRNLTDEVTLQAGVADDEDEEISPDKLLQARIDAIEAFVKLAPLPDSNLVCIQCQLDDTFSPAEKARRYTKYQLDRHLSSMKSNPHSREEQIKRAINNTLKAADDDTLDCPLCDVTGLKKSNALTHLKKQHAAHLRDL
jgi:hypothetical protein